MLKCFHPVSPMNFRRKCWIMTRRWPIIHIENEHPKIPMISFSKLIANKLSWGPKFPPWSDQADPQFRFFKNFGGPCPWIPDAKLTFLQNKNYNRGNVHCSLYNLLHILTDNQFQLCNQWCIEHMNLHSRQCTFSILKWIRVRLTSLTKIPGDPGEIQTCQIGAFWILVCVCAAEN